MKYVATLPDGHGFVEFTQRSIFSRVRVTFAMRNFEPGATHAIHIHEFGDERDGCTSLGGHWNPFRRTHGSRLHKGMPRHAGDLINNFTADDKGSFDGSYDDELLTLSGKNSILGRSVVIHAGVDDLGLGGNEDSLKTGNAGARLLCAIIGIAAS